MDPVATLLEMSPQLRENMRPSSDHVMVCCPFHKENTPSMAISLSKPVFFCHGCKESGHISRLLKMAGMSSLQIDLILPRNADRIAYKKKNVAARLMRGENPFSPRYILDEDLLDVYRLAPTALLRAGYEKQTLRHFEVGYDSKNVRITFPLRTVHGDLVGVSGRALLEGVSRYKIYDQELKERTDFTVPDDYTMEGVKKSILWHAHLVRPLFFKKGYEQTPLIITEGFKAAMWTWQCGYQDVIALVGSYLTEEHAELIARAAKNVLLFLDNNEAGRKGTFIAAQRLLKKGVRVDVANYPDEREQPDALSSEEIGWAFETCLSARAWIRNEIDHFNTQPAKAGTI